MFSKKLGVAVFVFAIAASFSGCAGRGAIKDDPNKKQAEAAAAEAAKPQDNVPPLLPGMNNDSLQETSAEANIRGTDFVAVDGLASVQFDFDNYHVRDDQKTLLEKNAAFIKGHKTPADVLVEGHCDDRGTIEYNIALGQRRAQTIREYYIQLGIAPGDITTISYGEEKPVCREETEDCWTKNRRAETKLRAKAQ